MGARQRDPAFGARMKAAREAKGLTLKEVGEQFGITPQAVSGWENGSQPSRLLEVCALYGIDYNFALTGIASREHMKNTEVRPVSHSRGRIVPRFSVVEVMERYRAPIAGQNLTAPLSHTQFPCSDQSYFLTVPDGSNEPVFQAGDYVVIDPSCKRCRATWFWQRSARISGRSFAC